MDNQFGYKYRWIYSTLSLFALLTLWSVSATAQDDGKEIYDKTCQLCHGIITEPTTTIVPTASAPFLSNDEDEFQLAVVTPRGPTLNKIVGRPVAIISNYSYSKAMRKFAETGAKWDRETLDEYITNSRKLVKGFMVLRMEEEDRKLVLDYLESVATYQEEDTEVEVSSFISINASMK